jgi:hypothetical protein
MRLKTCFIFKTNLFNILFYYFSCYLEKMLSESQRKVYVQTITECYMILDSSPHYIKSAIVTICGRDWRLNRTTIKSEAINLKIVLLHDGPDSQELRVLRQDVFELLPEIKLFR